MDLNSFEEVINPRILARGWDYFQGNCIVESTVLKEGEYKFLVQGSVTYRVTVKLGTSGGILSTECSCPYDYGPYCKHQAAVFYALQESMAVEGESIPLPKTKKQPPLKELLNRLTKEELISLVLESAEKDFIFTNELFLRYGRQKPSAVLKRFKLALSSIVAEYTDRAGFISYHEADYFSGDLETQLQYAKDVENPLLSIDMAGAFLEEVVGAFEYTDDSSGGIDYLAEITIDWLNELAEWLKDTKTVVREQAFYKLLDLANSTYLEDWIEYRIRLLSVCSQFADFEDLRSALVKTLKKQLDHLEAERYSQERLMNVLLSIIEKYGPEEAAIHFLKENVTFPSIRKQYILYLMEKKEYPKALEVISEGEKQDKIYPGIVHNWKKMRFEIYKIQNLKTEQFYLAKELLLAGEFDYYDDLKELAKDLSVPDFYPEIKKELEQTNNWHGVSVYLKVIEQEEDWKALLVFVKKNLSYLEQYANKLDMHFHDEVVVLHEEYIRNKAQQSSNRKHYKDVCSVIRRYRKIAGNTRSTTLVTELKGKYLRRPAFIDELNKLG